MRRTILFICLLLSTYSFSQEKADSVKTIPIRKENPEDETFIDPEEEAAFPKAYGSFNQWLGLNIHYPQRALEEGLQGRVYVKFVVESDGSITQAQVIRGIKGCPECDVEALRIIQSMPPWNPSKLNGNPVRSWIQIPINFTLM